MVKAAVEIADYTPILYYYIKEEEEYLQTKDGRPIQVCFICCGSLQNCYKLKNKCLQSEELFTRVLSSDVFQQTELQDGCTQRLRVEHPVIHLSIGDVLRSNTEDSAETAGASDVHRVTRELQHTQDIKMEPQEEHDTQIDDDIQSSHLEDPLDVMNREPDDVETGAEDIKFGIDDITIEENEPYSAHPSSLSTNDICPKTVKVVLERIVLNDTTPVIGVPALKKLTKTDSLLSKPGNIDRSIVIDKLTAISKIHETVDKVDATLHKHIDICHQTSESNICSVKNSYSLKALLELQTRTHTDIEMEPQEHDTQIDNDIQCSHLENPLDVMNREPDDVETDAHDTKLEIDDITIKTNEPRSVHRFSVSTNDICPKTVKVVLERVVPNDTTPVTGAALKKLAKSDYFLSTKSENANKSIMRDKLTAASDIHAPVDKIDVTSHRHAYIYKQTSESDIYSIKKGCSSKAHVKLQTTRTHTGEKQFTCDVCNKYFSIKQGLKRHMYTHTGEKRLKCDLCNKTLTTKYSLTQHMHIHTGEKPFMCDVCNQRFNFKSGLKIHMYTHIGKKPFKCHVCNKPFAIKYLLTQHMYTHTGEKRFKCDLCNKTFTTKRSLTQHMHIHTGEKPFMCDVCNKRFNFKISLKTHMYTHTGEKRFKCDLCNKTFTTKRGLTQHMPIHTGEKPFMCDVCNKRFNFKISLKTHMYTHTGEKPFKCHVCNKAFVLKTLLTQHMYTHTGEERFECDLCNKTFTTKYSLTQHMHIHTGEKPFMCDVCNQRFNFKSCLDNHMYTHSGEKPFKCHVCNETFKLESLLKKHMYTHTGEKLFECDVCNQRFIYKRCLKIHMYTHTGEKPFKCHVCIKYCTTKWNLTQHMHTHTGEKPFKCDVCNKCFTVKNNLKRHMHIHTSGKQFKCDVCQKRFPDKDSLKLHVVHTHW